MTLPTDAKDRKNIPLCTGLLDYFPDSLAAVAELSRIGNEQHNPGQPLHWAREKSTDHADCIVRHLMERGTIDTDGQRHAAKVAWRALALLQTEIEKDRAKPKSMEDVIFHNCTSVTPWEKGSTFAMKDVGEVVQIEQLPGESLTAAIERTKREAGMI